MQQITEKRYGLQQDYRPIVSNAPSEWCQVMWDSTVNPLYKFVVEVVSNSVPDLLHICPYIVIYLSSSIFLNNINFYLFINYRDQIMQQT